MHVLKDTGKKVGGGKHVGNAGKQPYSVSLLSESIM
jgi:hypothetical protein